MSYPAEYSYPPQAAPPPPPPPPPLPPPAYHQVTIIQHHVKQTSMKTSYLEFCPKCQTTVMTSCHAQIGICWWLICFVGFFLFCWPILFCLCCDSSKDIDHNCPNCGILIAKSKRTGF